MRNRAIVIMAQGRTRSEDKREGTMLRGSLERQADGGMQSIRTSMGALGVGATIVLA